jgi:hypothetical protein
MRLGEMKFSPFPKERAAAHFALVGTKKNQIFFYFFCFPFSPKRSILI